MMMPSGWLLISMVASAPRSPGASPCPTGFSLPAPHAEKPAPVGVGAYVLEDHTRLSHRGRYGDPDDHTTTLEVQRRIQVVSRDGQPFADVRIRLLEGESVEKFKARTVLPNGEQIFFDKTRLASIDDAKGPDRVRKTHVFAFPQAIPGSVIEYRYSIRSKGWRLAHWHTLDTRLPIRSASFELCTGDFLSFFRKAQGIGPRESKEIRRGWRRHTWRASDVPASPRVAFAPNVSQQAPYVALTIFSVERWHLVRVGNTLDFRPETIRFSNTWPILAEAIQSRVAAAAAANPPVRLPDLGTSERARAEAVWRWTQANLHERSSLATKHDPLRRTPAAIIESRYATPNERAVVMFSLLRKQGLPAQLWFVPNEHMHDFRESLVTPYYWGADLVAAFEAGRDEPTFLDPRCRGCALGTLARAHRGRGSLRFTTTGAGRIEVTSGKEDTSDEIVRKTFELVPSSRGIVARTGRVVLVGAAAARLRSRFAARPPQPAGVDEWLRREQFEGTSEGRMFVDGLDDLGKPLSFRLENVLISRRGYLEAGDWLAFSLHLVVHEPWLHAFRPDRQAVVEFDVRPAFENEIRFEVPRGYDLLGTPSPVTVENGVGRYTLHTTVEDRLVTMRESLVLKTKTVAVADYPALRSFVSRVIAGRAQQITTRRVR